jgi:hypothetical protein
MREVWMQDALRCVLDDELDHLLNHLNYQLAGLSKNKQTILQKVIRYLNRVWLLYVLNSCRAIHHKLFGNGIRM